MNSGSVSAASTLTMVSVGSSSSTIASASRVNLLVVVGGVTLCRGG